MTTTKLRTGEVLHIPGAPFIVDSVNVIEAPTDDELERIVPLIEDRDLLLFAKRLVDGSRRRRREPRWQKVNAARLKLAKLCIDRVLKAHI